MHWRSTRIPRWHCSRSTSRMPSISSNGTSSSKLLLRGSLLLSAGRAGVTLTLHCCCTTIANCSLLGVEFSRATISCALQSLVDRIAELMPTYQNWYMDDGGVIGDTALLMKVWKS